MRQLLNLYPKYTTESRHPSDIALTTSSQHAKRSPLNLKFLTNLFGKGASKDTAFLGAGEKQLVRKAAATVESKGAATIQRGAATIERKAVANAEQNVVGRTSQITRQKPLPARLTKPLPPLPAGAKSVPNTLHPNVATTPHVEGGVIPHSGGTTLHANGVVTTPHINAGVTHVATPNVASTASTAALKAEEAAAAANAKPLAIFGHLKANAGTILNAAMLLPILWEPGKAVYHYVTGSKSDEEEQAIKECQAQAEEAGIEDPEVACKDVKPMTKAEQKAAAKKARKETVEGGSEETAPAVVGMYSLLIDPALSKDPNAPAEAPSK
ncbi:hypothetical protein FRB95_013754 [Tulasnella sp. JGI-2019a]|nr:hypothetical protein FRB95_013754 [Tulasnella sp. JGI-2019a]